MGPTLPPTLTINQHLPQPSVNFGTQKSNLNSDGENVGPSDRLWTQSAPHGSLKAALWSSIGAPNPQKPSKTHRKTYIFKNQLNVNFRPYLDILLAQMAARWSPRVPQGCPREPKSLPFGALFRTISDILADPALGGHTKAPKVARSSYNEP